MRVVRVGIIGQGRSGRNIHAEYLKTQKEKFEIVAVADLIKDRCERAEKEYGCKSFLNYKDMLADKSLNLDIVVNSSFSHMHAPISKEVMLSGHNVLSEKPFASSAEEIRELVSVSKTTGRLLAVFQQSRFAPEYINLLNVLRSGKLGPIKMIKIACNGFSRRYDWQTLQSYNAGGLLNTGPHPLDQALGLLGRDVMPNVLCKLDTVNTMGDADDFCKLILTYPGRPLIDLEVCSNMSYQGYHYQVYGTYGSMTSTAEGAKWKYYNPEELPECKLEKDPLPGPSYCKCALPEWHEEEWTPTKDDSQLFNVISHAFYCNLYDVIVNNAPLAIRPEEIEQQLAIIEECHRQNPLPKKF